MPTCPSCHGQIEAGIDQCPHCRALIAGLPPLPSDGLVRRVQALLDNGQKIEAIKLYREEIASSLLDAKRAVEALDAGRQPPPERERSAADNWQDDVLSLLSQGKKIQAVKLYQQRMGGGLQAAKQAVEALGDQQGILGGGGGCLGMVLLVVAATICWLA
jgi:large subunit ribosomal protein L7/L12